MWPFLWISVILILVIYLLTIHLSEEHYVWAKYTFGIESHYHLFLQGDHYFPTHQKGLHIWKWSLEKEIVEEWYNNSILKTVKFFYFFGTTIMSCWTTVFNYLKCNLWTLILHVNEAVLKISNSSVDTFCIWVCGK